MKTHGNRKNLAAILLQNLTLSDNFQGVNSRPKPGRAAPPSSSVSRGQRSAGLEGDHHRSAFSLIDNARTPKLLHRPIAILRVESHKAALLYVRQDLPAHHGCDGAHTALKISRDFAFRFPMDDLVQRPPTADVPVLHFMKNLLADKLAPVGPDHLYVGPLRMAGNENRFAQIGVG